MTNSVNNTTLCIINHVIDFILNLKVKPTLIRVKSEIIKYTFRELILTGLIFLINGLIVEFHYFHSEKAGGRHSYYLCHISNISVLFLTHFSTTNDRYQKNFTF